MTQITLYDTVSSRFFQPSFDCQVPSWFEWVPSLRTTLVRPQEISSAMRAVEVHDVRLCHGEGLASWLFCFFLWLLVLLIFVILSSNVEYVGETHVKSTGLKFIEFVQRAQKVVYSMPYCNIMYILSVVLSCGLHIDTSYCST